MADLTNADIDLVIDKAICCSGTMAAKAAKEFSYGLKCAKDTLTKVKLLNAYIEILSDYEVINDEEVPASGTVAITGSSGTIQLTIGGRTASAVVTYAASVANTATLLAASVNAYTDGLIAYTAVQTLGTGKLTITAEEGYGDILNGDLIGARVTGTMAVTGTATTLVMAGGTNEITNGDSVIEEADALTIIENIGKICGLCFPPAGSTYQ